MVQSLRKLANAYWNLQILFGRDLSELGSLGHPPSLAQVERASREDGAPAANDVVRPLRRG
jgi:hypothetical protein